MKHVTDSFSGKGRDLLVKTNHSILLKESTGQELMVAEAEHGCEGWTWPRVLSLRGGRERRKKK